jgi:glycosyltransferase involved in cell wall biosynthesis
LLESCSAVCVAGEEDFGIVAVEAQAAGKPVVAYRRGGARESVEDGVSGVLFDQQTVEAVAAAITACAGLQTTPERIASGVRRFSATAFRDGLSSVITAARERHPLDLSAQLPMRVI